jgi:hypothetical protein
MLGRLLHLNQKSNQVSKLLNLLVYPFLIGFVLDLPWISQLLISIAFVIATVAVHDFVDALLYLWQATAVAGLFFVILDYTSDIELNQTVCALSIPVVWIFVLMFKRKCNGGGSTVELKSIQTEIVGVVSTAMLFFIVPRGQLQNLNFLAKGEDSAQYLMASTTLLRGQELHLATSFGASSFLYFYNFLNNGFLCLAKYSEDSESNSLMIALNVLSNAWVFVLVSSILFTIRIVSFVKQKITPDSANSGLFFMIPVSSFLFFRASQDVGHFTQYLLNCAVLVFLLSLITIPQHSRFATKLGFCALTFATALSLAGSYGPWLPMTIVGIVLTANAAFPHSPIRVVVNSRYLFVTVIIFVFTWVYMLKKLYDGSNLEMGGGVAVIPLEAVWLVLILTIIIIGSFIVGRFQNSVKSDTSNTFKANKLETTLTFVTAVLICAAILDRTSFNQLTTLSFVVLVGLLFRPSSVPQLIRNFNSIIQHKEFDGVLVLALASFLYVFSIYLLARFIGPIYEPMYAANKSMFAFFGQFSWLMFLLVLGGSNSLSRFTRVIKNVTFAGTILIVLGLTNFTRYDEVQKQWWHDPSIVALKENPDALIACVNPILTIDYETYKCNRFMNTLTNHGYSATSFMWVSLGDSPTGLAYWFNRNGPENGVKFEADVKVVVLSQDDLSAVALSIFEGVSENMIDFRVIRL